MKNKKLFAILTLVCFMFTLMPVAAFAAESVVYDMDQVYVEGKKAVTVTYEEAKAGVDVAVGQTDGSLVAGGYAYFVEANEKGVDVTISTTLTFTKAGTYKVYAVAGVDDLTDLTVNDFTTTAEKVATLKKFAVAENKLMAVATVVVKDAAGTYTIEFAGTNVTDSDDEDSALDTLTINNNNGWSEDGTVTITLKNDNPNVVCANKELSINAVGAIKVTLKDDNVTDRASKVVMNVTGDKAGTYKVVVKYGSVSETLTVKVKGGTAVSVAATEPAAPVNYKAEAIAAERPNAGKYATGIKFTFKDASGYTVSESVGANLKVTLTAPADSNKTFANDFELVNGVVVGKTAWDAEGDYTFKAVLASGASAEATVTVAEQGEVVGIKFVNAPSTVAYNAKDKSVVGDGIVTVDAKGVTSTVDAEYSVTGKAVSEFEDGVVTLKAQTEAYIGSTITVYAVYGDFIATNTVTLIDVPADVVYASTEAQVGVYTTLYANVVDASGNKVALASATPQAIVLSQPEGAVVVANAEWNTVNGANNVALSFLANKAGEYSIQTIVTYDDGAGAVRYLSTVDTFVVGGADADFNDVVVISMGANSMIVNNELIKLDVAPFIENNRTMLQYNVLYVFGIDVQWVKETESVVAEGNGTKVVMTLGSKVATVNGAEVALDVAPYSLNGRTIVPVGLITGVFGINYDFTYNADGTIADILFTK